MERVKKLLKRFPLDVFDDIVRDARAERFDHVKHKMLQFCVDLGIGDNLKWIWIDNNDWTLHLIQHFNSCCAIRFTNNANVIRIDPNFKVIRSNRMCYRYNLTLYDSFNVELSKLLGFDVTKSFDKQELKPNCPLLRIANELHLLLYFSAYYTCLTMLCIHRWRKESLVAQLPKDVLLYLLKNFVKE